MVNSDIYSRSGNRLKTSRFSQGIVFSRLSISCTTSKALTHIHARGNELLHGNVQNSISWFLCSQRHFSNFPLFVLDVRRSWINYQSQVITSSTFDDAAHLFSISVWMVTWVCVRQCDEWSELAYAIELLSTIKSLSNSKAKWSSASHFEQMFLKCLCVSSTLANGTIFIHSNSIHRKQTSLQDHLLKFTFRFSSLHFRKSFRFVFEKPFFEMKMHKRNIEQV